MVYKQGLTDSLRLRLTHQKDNGNRYKVITNKQLTEGEGEKMSFKIGFKGLNRVRLSNVNREVIPEEGGKIGKGPDSGELQEPCDGI